MMIINNTSKNFWSNGQKFLSLVTIKKTIVLVLFAFLYVSCVGNKNLELESLKTEKGWGYVIKENDKIIIKQSIIPVITNNRSFESENDALKVGQLVLQKLKNNNTPTVTKEDLIALEIKV